MTEYVHVDDRLDDLHIKVYDLMRTSILETGEPMKQGILANKLRAARATIRNALIVLSDNDHIHFSRYKPLATTLVDPDRLLANSEAQLWRGGHPVIPMPWDAHG